MLLRPRPLQRGDRISIVAPSSPISDMSALKRAERVFNRHDLELVWGKNITRLRSDCWHSAGWSERVDELHEAFADETTSCVWVAEGGYSAIDVIPYLDYNLIREGGKIFVGMSDVTVINNALIARSGLVNFSGMNIRCRCKFESDAASLDLTIMMLMTDGKWLGEPFSQAREEPRCVCPGIVKGPALGGNMTLFTGLIGTPYIPDCTGAILFFEDTHAGGYEASTNISRLELSGVLDKAAGVVFGEFTEKINRGDQDMCIEDVIVRKFRDKMPCIYGMNFSHGSTCACIPLGCEAIMNAEDGSVEFGNPFVESI